MNSVKPDQNDHSRLGPSIYVYWVRAQVKADPSLCWLIKPFFFFFFFSIYCQTLFRVSSAGVLCTLRDAGWKPTSNHIEITVGFFNLHKGWLSLHRGHPVNVPIRRMMHLSSVIPANDTRESVFGHRNFPRRERGSNLGPLAPEASA